MERQEQVEFMWRQNLPDLHVNIPRSKKDSWFQWALSRTQGKSFFCSAVGSTGASERIIKRYAPPGSDIQDPKIIVKSYEEARKCLVSGWTVSPDEFYSSELQKARIATRWVTAPKSIQKGEVKVWYPNGIVHFTWQNPAGEIKRINIKGAKSWIPQTTNAKRYISFTAEGLSLLDENENVLFYPRTSGASTTWSKTDISKLPQCADRVLEISSPERSLARRRCHS